MNNLRTCRWLFFAVLIMLLSSLSVFADEAAAETSADAELYMFGLEQLVRDDKVGAGISFTGLLEQFPDSLYAGKAAGYLEEIGNETDNSGIVSFYLGNLAVSVYTAVQLTNILDLDMDTATVGAAGITGVAAGLGSAWLMSADWPVSRDTEWWIETAQVISLGNYLYISSIFNPGDYWDYPVAEKIRTGGQLLTLLGSRAASYFRFRSDPPPKGKGSFMLQSYAWAHVYYFLFAGGVLQVDDPDIMEIGGLIVSDTVAFSSALVWDRLQWSTLRTGLVTVGGVGGGLLGVFTVMILEELISPDSRISTALILGAAIAGKAAAVTLTSSMPSAGTEQAAAASPPFMVSLFPVVQNRTPKAGISFRMTW